MVRVVILTIVVLAVFSLRVAVDRGFSAHRHRLVWHSGDRSAGHGEGSPADEEDAEQHCCQETSETHACR